MKTIKKLLGWLFSNLLLIAIVLVVSYGFVYWDDPIGTDAPLGKVVTALSPQGETSDAQPLAQQPQPVEPTMLAEDDLAEIDLTENDLAENDVTEIDRAEDYLVENYLAENAQDVAAASGDATERSVPAERSIPVGTSLEMDVMQIPPVEPVARFEPADTVAVEIDQQPSRIIEQTDNANTARWEQPGTEPGSVLAAEAPAASAVRQSDEDVARQLIIDARQAFHRGNHASSIASYEKLIALQQDNFDVLGELGNVYYTRGEMDRAADAWFRSAMIMVSQGDKARAASLLGFLGSVDREKADRLAKSLNAANGDPQPLY